MKPILRLIAPCVVPAALLSSSSLSRAGEFEFDGLSDAEIAAKCPDIDWSDLGVTYKTPITSLLTVNFGGEIGGSTSRGAGGGYVGGTSGILQLTDSLAADWFMRVGSFESKDAKAETSFVGRGTISLASHSFAREVYNDGYLGSSSDASYYCRNIQHARDLRGLGLAVQYDTYTSRPSIGLSYMELFSRNKEDYTEGGNISLLYFIGGGVGLGLNFDRLWSGTDGFGLGWGGHLDLYFNKVGEEWDAVFLLGLHLTLGATNLL